MSTGDPDFTVLPSGRALFVGEDTTAKFNLWVTDGTSAGTSELVVGGANAHGLFYNGTKEAVSDLTVFGSKALFAGFDNNGHINLWVTDGTVAGTSELVVTGANPSGLFYNNGPVLDPQFTVVGNKGLFAGYDVRGHVNLWITDGTGAGTSELATTGANTAGLNPSDFFVISAPSPALSDVDGNGTSDITWQNNSGEAFVWELNWISTIAGGSLGNPGPSWRVKGTGDFNGDGHSDILWQNVSGEAYVWELNGTSVVGRGSLRNPGPSWHVKGSGDFNGDGFSDVLWQNTSGEVYLGDERNHAGRRRQPRQSGVELARAGSAGGMAAARRFQRRRLFRHPVSKQQRRGLHLGIERDRCGRPRQPRQSGVELARDRDG